MNIRLVATDVDGVLTDNTFVYDYELTKRRRWNMADGVAAQKLKAAGIQVVFLTQEESADIVQRAKALDVLVIVGGTDKLEALKRLYLHPRGILLDAVAYIGNEENDLPVLHAVGHAFMPADAWLDFKHLTHGHQLARKGGDGCLREVAEWVLRHES